MKKSLLALALFSVVSNSLDAAWTVPPPPSASVGAAISVSAVGTAYSGYSPSTAMTMWWQNPAGTWTSSDIGGGVNFGSMSGNQSITLDAVGTWTFYVTRRSSGGTPSPSDEKISSVNTTQVTGASVNFIFASLLQSHCIGSHCLGKWMISTRQYPHLGTIFWQFYQYAIDAIKASA